MAYSSKPKIRVNAGGMTQTQVDMILRLARDKAWDHPTGVTQQMREFYAMHIGDVESNPATSVLTGGWEGTASKLIGSLKKLPTTADVLDREAKRRDLADAVDGIVELLTPDPWGQAIAKETVEFANSYVPDSDPWAGPIEMPSPAVQVSNIAAELNADPNQLVGPGVYVLNGEFYAVKESTKNPGRHYAHRIVREGNKYKHIYAAGAIFKLTEEMRAAASQVIAMNLDTIHFDEKRGRKIGACCVCGRLLTNKTSVERGIGPICGGKVGL